jgi:CO/xanthine dehydrogenase Mo-binding subunit
MLMAASALLAQDPNPTDAAIDAAMSSVLCRCGTYKRVRRAIHLAAQRNWADAPFPEVRMTSHAALPADAIRFNPWVKIARDGTVIVTASRSEMGQGVTTSLPMMVAEELEIPMDRVRFEFAPADRAYDNPIIHRQITVGSLSMQTTWEPVRRAGAEVRERAPRSRAAFARRLLRDGKIQRNDGDASIALALRDALSRARADRTDELHRAHRRRLMRGLGPDAKPRPRAGSRGARRRIAARRRQDTQHLPRG